jgi:hypothetical protein
MATSKLACYFAKFCSRFCGSGHICTMYMSASAIVISSSRDQNGLNIVRNSIKS